MARWLSFFAEYILELKYKPSSKNASYDALSRRSDYDLTHVMMLLSPITDLTRALCANTDHCVGLLHVLGSKVFKDSYINSTLSISRSFER